MVVFLDEDKKFQPYRGELLWKQKQFSVSKLNRDQLQSVFGEWYWLDSDDDESIAFYEYPNYEMQIELTRSGAVKRFLLTKNSLMADPDTRRSYHVDKAWPPQFVR